MTDQIKYFLGTGFYSGLSPVAPGTIGSLFAIFIIFGFIQAQLYGLLFAYLLIAAVISLWVSGYFENKFGEDPGRLVVDEWAGQSLTFIAISFSDDVQANITILVTGFLLFRFFDILKPLGIKKIQSLAGKWGILLDDLLAGFYALICLKSLIFVGPTIIGWFT
jgi:phosphatidylglycerophosphatase A